MRAITAKEIEKIAGGLAKRHPHLHAHTMTQTLSTVSVTGTYPGGGGILPVGGGGGGGTGGSPVAGIGPGDGDSGGETEQQEENALKALAEELQALARGGDTTVLDWIEMTEDVAGIGAGEFADNLAAGEWSWNAYQETGDPSDALPGGENWPINWENFNWAAIPGARSAPSFDAALQDAINWAHGQE